MNPQGSVRYQVKELLGRRQAVRPGVLIPVCAGSNPAAPAIFEARRASAGRQDENLKVRHVSRSERERESGPEGVRARPE